MIFQYLKWEQITRGYRISVFSCKTNPWFNYEYFLAHLEGFGSIENIAKTKGALFSSLKHGMSFVNYADEKVKNAHSTGNKISYGLIAECDFPADIHYDDRIYYINNRR